MLTLSRPSSTPIDKQLNPAAFVEVKRPKRLFAKKPFRSGGWGDPRDLKLCLDMIHNDYVNLTLIRSMTWIYFFFLPNKYN